MFDFSIMEALTTTILICIMSLACKLLIRPLFLIEFYKQQGFTPNYYPIIGQLATYKSDTEKYKDAYHSVKQQINNDPNFKGSVMSVGGKCYVFLSDVNLIREFSQNQAEISIKDPLFSFSLALVSQKNYKNLGRDYHKHYRKILSAAFHFEFLKEMVSTVQELVTETLVNWEMQGLTNIDVLLEMSSIAGKAVNKSFFGTDLKSHTFKNKRLTDAIPEISSMIGRLAYSPAFLLFGPKLFNLNLLPFHRKLRSTIKDFKECCLKIVKARKEVIVQDQSKANTKYIADNLLLLQQDPNNKYPMSDKEILDNYTLFFKAGQDNTATLLTMCMYILSRHPECVERLREEIQTNVPDVSQITYEDLGKLEYLTAFIKEMLRLYNPGSQILPRLLSKDCVMGGIKFKKGTGISVYLFYACCNKKYFKDPERFDPNRWMPGGEGCMLPDPMLFIPFWSGIHNCIGQHVLWIKIKVILMRVVAKYNVKVKPDYELKMCLKSIYCSVNPLMMDLERVNQENA